MSIDPVRRRALRVLCEVEAGEPLDETLGAALRKCRKVESRAFLAELVLGTIRFQMRYDQVIAHFAHKGPPRGAALVWLLRLSLHQLLACDGVPAYAAVHQAGELCRWRPGKGKLRFVNGLLQSVARLLADEERSASDAVADLFPDPQRETLDYMATWHSHPRWLVKRWLDRYGPETCADICRSNNEAPPLWLHVLPPAEMEETTAALESEGFSVEAAGDEAPRAIRMLQRLGRADLRELLGRHRCLMVQDVAVQEATGWLAEGWSGRLLDLCAAPGGKTCHLVAMRPTDGNVVAADFSLQRMPRIRENAERLGISNLPLVCADGFRPPFETGSFDSVLLDGPCSGTGVLRHHAEGRWRLTEQKLRPSGARLLTLAKRAAMLLAPGGTVLYCTCSLEPEENEDVVDALLAADAGLEPDPRAGSDWRRHWLPEAGRGDGFFAARLRKRTDAPAPGSDIPTPGETT